MTETPLDPPPPTPYLGNLTLGDIFTIAEAPDPRSIVVIRHTYRPTGLRSAADVNPESVLAYTSNQERKNSMFRTRPLWLVFIADGKSRSRLYAAYDNLGEIEDRRTETESWYGLRESEFLRSLQNRLIVEWSNPVSWFMGGEPAMRFPVSEISDPQAIPFPGFDHIVLTHAELQEKVTDPRYSAWQTALSSVQGIYLIADASSGKQYVGQAAGEDTLLGRWTAYATTGHGGNKALRELLMADPDHAQNFVFSILRVFGSNTPDDEIYAAESHYKTALLTRQFGLNHN